MIEKTFLIFEPLLKDFELDSLSEDLKNRKNDLEAFALLTSTRFNNSQCCAALIYSVWGLCVIKCCIGQALQVALE